MKPKATRFLLVGGVLLLIIFLGGYLLLSGGRGYSKDMGSLRAQFNQDKGKVRLLMVLSPT